MSRRFVASLALCFVILLGVSPAGRAEEKEAEADPKKLTEQVETLLESYNKNEAKAFYANWAKSVESIATTQTYDALYRNGAKKEFGDYKPKTLKFRKEGSVLTGDFLVVYFEGEFSKEKSGLVSVNFEKEKDAYKFVQVMIGKDEKKPK